MGSILRSFHLMTDPGLSKYTTTYPVMGDDAVQTVKYVDNKVFINQTQYFGGVPEVAWNLYIGGYQPAQRWLKDRQGKRLTNSDLDHYQKIITILTKTSEIMQKIDKVINAN